MVADLNGARKDNDTEISLVDSCSENDGDFEELNTRMLLSKSSDHAVPPSSPIERKKRSLSSSLFGLF